MLKRRLDRCGAFHVDAGIAEQIERIFGTTGFQKPQIVTEFTVGPPLSTRWASEIAADNPVAYL